MAYLTANIDYSDAAREIVRDGELSEMIEALAYEYSDMKPETFFQLVFHPGFIG